jgi:hypothetical protein
LGTSSAAYCSGESGKTPRAAVSRKHKVHIRLRDVAEHNFVSRLDPSDDWTGYAG